MSVVVVVVVVIKINVIMLHFVVVQVVLSGVGVVARVLVGWRARGGRLVHGRQNLGLLPLGDAAKTDGVTGHADRDALLQATVLTPVPVDPHDGALLVLAAGPVLDLLLDRAAKEALAALAGVDTIVESGGLVATHLA